MNQPDDLVSVLIEEHRELVQLRTELEQLTEFEPLRRSLATLMIAETVRHVVAEETYLYPVIRERLPGGQRIVTRHLAEHIRIEQTLKRLERPDLTDAEFSLLLARLNTEAHPHQRADEDELFPLLAQHLSTEELTALGRKMAQAKAKASIPQRLTEPDSPLLHRPRAQGTTLVERVRTHLRGSAYPVGGGPRAGPAKGCAAYST